MLKKIYFSYRMTGRRDWKFREDILKTLRKANFVVFDPKEHHAPLLSIKHHSGISSKIVKEDKKELDSIDLLLAYFDEPSVGQSMEIYISWMRRIPVVVLDASGGKMLNLSPWLAEHSTMIIKYNKKVDVIELIKRFLNE